MIERRERRSLRKRGKGEENKVGRLERMRRDYCRQEKEEEQEKEVRK